MKKIILVRHGKSSKKFTELKDLERPLKKRGLNDAPFMGKVLHEHHLVPDAVFTSPALRAITTAQMIAKELGVSDTNIITNPNLYLESKSKLLKEINALDNTLNTVIFVGHNPGLTNLANYLTRKSIDNIPTSAAAAIQFECNSWAEVGRQKGKLLFLDVPKKLRKKIKKAQKQDALAEPQVS
jgi:phosphohistidine phosphatase